MSFAGSLAPMSLVVLLSTAWVCALLASSAEVNLPRHQAAKEDYDKHPLVEFLSAVRDTGPTTPCAPTDPTLPRQPPDPSARYLVAAILTDADRIMPQLLTQLIPVLLVFRRSHVHVSIYESGSSDNTAAWLRLLQSVLDALRIPNTIITSGVTRTASEDRIAYLARLRNHALAPLFPAPASPHLDPAAPAPPFPAEHVVFLNDVAFCAQDVLRLLQHAPSTDIACGLDLQNWAGSSHPRPTDFARLASLIPPRMPPVPRGLRSYLLTLWQQRFTPPPTENLAPPLQFYDGWVAHDLDGRGLRVEYPYANVPASRARSERGLPFPVQCCWNGLAVLRAAPFHAGLRFRSHVDGECYESECTLLCDDFWRLNRTRVLVDPSVRVTYCPSLYKPAYSLQHPTATWQQARAAPVDWSEVKAPRLTECCEGKSWDQCKLHFPWLAKNYTEIAIRHNFPFSDMCYALTTAPDRCKRTAVDLGLASLPVVVDTAQDTGGRGESGAGGGVRVDAWLLGVALAGGLALAMLGL